MSLRASARCALAALAVACIAGAAVGCDEVPDRAPSRPVTVAVVDTGVDPDAPLGGRLDADASTSVLRPGGGSASWDDLDGHGTEMASVVHAAAPAARLVAVKVVGPDGTSDEALASGIDRARAADAQVILVSLAGAEPLPRTRAAIARAGRDDVLVVAAAGNDGVDIDRHPTYPAGYDEPNLVPVAAVDHRGRLLGSSNRGVAVRVRGQGAAVPACGLDGQATTTGGTSAAAAVVAGRAARLLRRSVARAELRRQLERSPAHALPVECT